MSTEDKAKTELSYTSACGSKYVAPPIQKPYSNPSSSSSFFMLPWLSTALPPLEEITKEPTFICDNLDGLLREVDEERARDLQEGSSNLVVHLPPRVGSEEWRRLNGIHQMHPGPGQRV